MSSSEDKPLPHGWSYARLKEVGQWGTGGTPPRSNAANFGGTIPWVKIRDMPDGPIVSIEESITELGLRNSSAKLIPPNTLLVAMYGASISKLGLTTQECVTNQAIAHCVAFPGVDVRYLFYAIRSIRQELISSGQGGAQPNISQGILLNFRIALAPSWEQSRIANRIETLFGEIEAGEQELERTREGLAAYRRSLLKAAVTGELTRDWRGANVPNETGAELLESLLGERRALNNQVSNTLASGLSRLPPGWVWASLDQLSWDTSYGTSAKCSPSADGPAVLRIPNIKRGSLDPTNLKFSTIALAVSDDDWVSPGDLLVVRTNGSENLIGRGGVAIESLAGKFYFASYLIRFRLLGDADLWKWISIVWDSPILRGFVKRNAASSAGQFNISQSKLAGVAIPVPPASEMKAVIQSFETLSIAINEMEASLAKAFPVTQLRQAVLSSAFRGRLVPQAVADEPADVLLERLRRERSVPPIRHRKNPRTRTSETRGSGLVEASE